MAYNSDPNTSTLAEHLARDTKLKGELWARALEIAATRRNVFSRFTTPLKGGAARAIKTPFASRRDLKAGGADSVNISVIGTPGGPGAEGSEELTPRLSKSLTRTYPIRVGWHRDGIALTKDEVEMLAAGGDLMSTSVKLLGDKMGVHRQNRMMMRLIKGVDGNTLRPNSRQTLNDLISTDVLSVDFSMEARAVLQRIGGRPITQTVDKHGSLVNGYMVFGGTAAFLDIRNDDGYQNVLAQGHNRGADNANFTGQLVNWQGMPFFEYDETDEAWDDYTGNPMAPTATITVGFDTSDAAADCKLVVNASNTTSLYFQFFSGFAYKFYQDETPSADSTEYYAWACNPDGSRAFLAYTGSGNNGNVITITKILATAAGTSTKGAKTVGDLTLGTTPSVSSHVLTQDASDGNLPDGFVYKDEVQEGAVIIPANSRGVTYGRSFVFGSMAACFAFGRIEMKMVEDSWDFGFVMGKGYEEIFGTGVTKNPRGKPVGYLLVEHAIEHVGYRCPSI